MNAAGRLIAYGAAVAVTFGGAFVAAGVAVPDRVVERWAAQATDSPHDESDHEATGTQPEATPQKGLSMSSQGYVLSEVSAPQSAAESGELVYMITGPDGSPVTEYQEAHEKEMHLIVVRTDGTQYRHVHPELDPSTGSWSLPWQWEEAGTYKIYADFAPTGDGEDTLTLSRTVDVASELTPVTDRPLSAKDEVDGFEVTLDGDLTAGTSSDLTLSVTQDGAPVTTLEPYLGAFGHLVALREGDMEYLHVHAEGEDPVPGETSGPEISFMADAPTAGRYYLYLDFQIDGEVHTAQFVVQAEQGTENESADAHPDGH
ncbi:hypothetical protein ACTXJ3_15415 [Brachybacterium paraconglomeratum]|uniref:hypothetical protein n=1 Tax=Brachybacterium paraconglomeratum TaxID=173362 RepID=UPI003FD249D6